MNYTYELWCPKVSQAKGKKLNGKIRESSASRIQGFDYLSW